jgi:hypothetical protein
MKPRIVVVVLLLLLAGAGNFALSTVREHLRTNPSIAGILDPIPLEIGQWTGEPTEVDSAIIKRTPGVITRTIVYRQEETGQLVWLALCVGPPGLVTEDLPEKTYRFIGYAYDNESRRFESLRSASNGKVDGTLARMNFWSQRSPAPMSVWHGWFDGTRWSRPEMARWKFLDRPVIARLQVWCTKERQPLDSDPNHWSDPSESFIREALPMVTDQLHELNRTWSSILTNEFVSK